MYRRFIALALIGLGGFLDPDAVFAAEPETVVSGARDAVAAEERFWGGASDPAVVGSNARGRAWPG